jgi:hypothetical protein
MSFPTKPTVNVWNVLPVLGVLLGLIFAMSAGLASEVKSDTFMITVFDNYYKVVSPPKREKKFTAILENKTLSTLVGRYQNNEGKVLAYVSVEAGKFNTTQLDFEVDEKLYFVPLSPSFQEVVLEVGKEAYEIPPQK